jgi:hypothetical protein
MSSCVVEHAYCGVCGLHTVYSSFAAPVAAGHAAILRLASSFVRRQHVPSTLHNSTIEPCGLLSGVLGMHGTFRLHSTGAALTAFQC